jgi:hypothetical protein
MFSDSIFKFLSIRNYGLCTVNVSYQIVLLHSRAIEFLVSGYQSTLKLWEYNKNKGFHTTLEAIIVTECLEIFSISHVNIKCMSSVSKTVSACIIILVLYDGGRDGLWNARYAFHVGWANILRRLHDKIFYTIVAAFIYWQMLLLVVNGFKAHSNTCPPYTQLQHWTYSGTYHHSHLSSNLVISIWLIEFWLVY